MPNPIQLINRLFKKRPDNALVHELYARGIGRPILAHPEMGALVLKGFLNTPLAATAAEHENSAEHVQIIEGIGVLDISGALVSRPMGLCSPLSYVEIQSGLDELLANESVSHIVLRVDSAGGEASGMFDLADYIFNARGTKPIIAVVDDMAYSAAYGIASAADQVIVSRTSGVGSVGVVAYHIDESERQRQKGVRVEYIYAGEKKIYGNPTEPLADEAREEIQAEVNRLYALFVEIVARNRGLDVQFVRDTQAGTFYGEEAVKQGFADAVLSFSQVLTELLTHGALPVPAGLEVKGAAETRPAATAQAEAENFPQDIAPTKVENEPTLNAAQQAEIRALCKAAGLEEVAADYIAAGTPPDVVRNDLLSALTAGEREIISAHTAASQTPQAAPEAPEGFAQWVYQQRRQG